MLPLKSEQMELEDVLGEQLAEHLRGVLDAYFTLSKYLAVDDIEAVPSALQRVARSAKQLAVSANQSGAEDLTEDANELHSLVSKLAVAPITDPEDARTRFGRISHELTRLLESNGGKTLFGKDLDQFECGMSGVGYERWLWWSPDIHNPYMGQRMLSCGTKLDALEP